jgi:hypothetical protein
MDDTTRQPMAGGANRPQLSFPLYLTAVIAALAWPRLAPDAGLFARLGPDATAILWVPFALWAAAEGILLVAPHVGALSAGDARRLAMARLVSGIRLLARCAVWLIPLVMILGADPLAWADRLTSSLLDLALAAAGIAIFLVAIPRAGRTDLSALAGRSDPTNPSRADEGSVRGGFVGARAGSAGRGAAGSGVTLDYAVPTSRDPLQATLRALRAGLRRAADFAVRAGVPVVRAAIRWTVAGAATLDPRLGTDPFVTLETATASVATHRAMRGASAYAANAAAGATVALAVSGSLLGRVAAFLRGTMAGDPDKPVIYGPAAIWTEKPLVKGVPILTRREPLKARTWRNDPAANELIELGSAILEAAHADALQHGNARGLRGGGMMPPGFEDEPDLPPAEIGKRLILTRAWARANYFAFILTTAPVVSNDILGRLTAANLAANVAAHSRFTRGQVLAWLHTEHDPNDTRAEVVVDDPARAGVVGTFLVFDRGEARTAPVSAPPSPADTDPDDEDDGSPFSRSPF